MSKAKSRIMQYFSFFIVGLCGALESGVAAGDHHESFVFLRNIDPTIQESVRYASHENFLGRAVTGYDVPAIVCTKDAAQALSKVQADLKTQGFELVVYDGYRPQQSVDDFIDWSQNHDQVAKQDYYATIDKATLFEKGYLAARSSHSRGSTFDLSVIPLDAKVHKLVRKIVRVGNEEIAYLDDGTLDMGTSFDTFHAASNHDSPLVSDDATRHRQILREAMSAHGFSDYQMEWWHYTLRSEPFPDNYFNFVVKHESQIDPELLKANQSHKVDKASKNDEL